MAIYRRRIEGLDLCPSIQSRVEKNEAQQRKTVRSGSSAQQRSFSNATGKGGTAAGGTAPPVSSPSIYSSGNRSLKKSNGSVGQSRVNPTAAWNSESSVAHTVQNGAHAQSQPPGPALPGTPDAAVLGIVKPPDSSVSRSARALPKAPSSQSAAATSELAASATLKGDVSRAFPLQFGTISPGFMNGMQIPARTSSAPPNLDEQKPDQLHHDSFRAVPTALIPTVPKQPQLRKDVGVNQSTTGESHPSAQTKRDGQVQITAPPCATHKSTVIPFAGMSIPVSYQQPQVPVQFSAPSSQIQSQGVTTTSLQMPLPLTVGNAPQVQQPVFVPGLQSHTLLPQGMLHQGQSLGFNPQLGHQMAPQLSMSIVPQYAQQQASKFGAPRKAVKITHPETHQELRLDKRTDSYSDVGSSGPMNQIPRSHANTPPQSQPIPSFPTAHQISYYSPMQPNSYSGSSIFFPSQTSLPLTSNQMTQSSSAPRYNFSVGQGGQTVSYMNPSALNSLPVNMTGPPIHGHSEQVSIDSTHDGHGLAVSAPMPSVQVTVKPAVTSSPISITQPANKESSSSHQQRGNEGPRFIPQGSGEIGLDRSVQHPKSVSGSPSSVPLPASGKHSTSTPTFISIQRPGPGVFSSDPVFPAAEAAPVVTITDDRRREPVKRSDSLKDKKQSKKDQQHCQQRHQAEASDSAGSLKSSSLKISRDVGSSDVDMRPVTTSSDNVQSPVEVVWSSTSVSSLPFTPEHNVSSEVGVSDAKTMPAMSGIFEAKSVVLAEGLQATSAGSFSASETSSDGVHMVERSPCEPSNLSGVEAEGKVSEILDTNCTKQEACASLELGPTQEASGASKQTTSETPDAAIQDDRNTEEPQSLPASKNSEGSKETELVSHKGVAASSAEEMVRADPLTNTDIKKIDTNDEAEVCAVECSYSSVGPKFPNPVDAEVASSSDVSSAGAYTNNTEDFSNTNHVEVAVWESSVQNQGTIPLVSTHMTQKHEGSGTDSSSGGSASASSSVSKDKLSVEANRVKNTAGKKKKRKDYLSRADAAGATSDLYMAYKAPKEKWEAAIASDSMEIPVSTNANQISADDAEKDVLASDEDSQFKAELDDWEDAAEISTPKLEASENGEQVGASGVTGKKKYSRDFLLTFSEQFNDLTVDFKTRSDIAVAIKNVLVSISHLDDRELHSNSARILDRPTGSRLDRWVSGMIEEDRWNKPPSSLGPVCDIHVEVGHGGPAGGFWLGQGGNLGVLRNPRGQLTGQFVGGILSWPMQSLSAQGGMLRNNADADRWQRAPGSQKGLIPSPHTPLQVMHKAERKYEVGKVSDKEEARQRQLKAILNKLTPQNFDKLFEQVKEVNIDSAVTLTGVISQIFDKALTEPTFCEMYANFCCHLVGELPDFSEDNEKITFERLLLNKCQEEFERGVREQAEANRVEEEGETKRSDEERKEKKVQARLRMLGNIRLIGELYKKMMLTERIMHECIQKLLGQYQNPDEEDVEALCKLMSTIGEMIDHPKAKEHIDAYFDRMAKLSNNQKLSSRVRFMLKDAIDLRKNRWQQRRKVEGPKKIDEVHRDAAQERQLQVGGRMSRGSNINMPARRGQPPDFGSRGSAGLAAPGGQPMGGLRTMPPQLRGYGVQDVRLDDRHSFESRTLSVPLSQRPIDDDSITLGPQGGLARGMSIRGQPPISSGSLADILSNSGDVRRMASVGPNGYGTAHSVSDWQYNSREELMPRGAPDRFLGASAYEQSNIEERAVNRDFRNPDRSFDRSTATVHIPGRTPGSLAGTQNAPSDNKVWPEERLREMSITAIREFYSANDEMEVATSIKDLNSPNFHPTMVSLWVTDSFERKDIDRDLLAKLLVNLCKSQEGVLNQVQLIKGFEYVFSTLEDAVYDAPRAAEFLGRILAQVIIEKIVPLREIGRLIHEGGEAPGQLRQLGLAADVLGSILEILRKEKGEAVLNEIRTRSNLQLEDFRPPDPNKSRKLDAFI